MKPPKRITAKWLRRHRFCETSVAKFARDFPRGVPFSVEGAEMVGKMAAAGFLEGCLVTPDVFSRDVYDTDLEFSFCGCRLTDDAVRQLNKDVKRIFDANGWWGGWWSAHGWAYHIASPEEVVHFCTWAITNWRENP